MLKRLGRSFIHGFIIMLLMAIVVITVRQTAVLRNIEFLNPLEDAFSDFDLTDLVFSKLRGPQKADTNITVINIGMLSRAELATMINIINQHNPKVIGFDVQLELARDSLQDIPLAQAFSQVKNLVMVSDLQPNADSTVKKRDYVKTSYNLFTQHAYTAFANFITKGKGNQLDLTSVRSFSPKEKTAKVIIDDGQQMDTVGLKKAQRKNTSAYEYAFGVKIAQIYAPKKAKAFLARNRNFEWINFRGNVSIDGATKFNVLDVEQLMTQQFEPNAVIKDKIVLLGFMGSSLQSRSFDDKLYTPLNENYMGRSAPDMYGVVVHANIISMILKGDFINDTPPWLNNIISFFIVLITVMIFSYIFIKVGIWYDALTILIQALIVLGILGLMIMVFFKTDTKMDLGAGLLGVIFSGIFVEIYHGFIRKLFGWRAPNEIQHQKDVATPPQKESEE
ncbi:CHASE2 domain-containing protein [uncultured Microscilla sp.]|uniref:CHASE2 domain-containing protein n=1 Tax=uncultured Microscilla sp. TaxID=432653 RepID=UPI002637B95F|nr:CHASE2 domain-containing protein [uncultured Microscilla sp.]